MLAANLRLKIILFYYNRAIESTYYSIMKRIYVIVIFFILPGCATTTSDLIGGTTGLAASGGVGSPDLLKPDKMYRIAANVVMGGGRYGGTLGRLECDMSLAPDINLGFTAGYFQDNKINSGRGLLLGTKYKMGLAETTGRYYWLTMVPQYNFMLANYPTVSPQFFYQDEILNLYNAYMNMAGCDFVLGLKTYLLGLDVHLGPYLGLYSFHATKDATLFFFAGKFSIHVFIEIEDVEAGLSCHLFSGSCDEGDFLDIFVSMDMGYNF